MLVKTLVPRLGPPVPATDVVVFLGPGGSGKSRALADLLTHATGHVEVSPSRLPAAVWQDVQLVSPLSENQLLLGLETLDEGEETLTLAGLDHSLTRSVQVVGRRESWNLLRRPVLSAQAVAKSDLGELLRLRFAVLNVRSVDSCLAPSPVGNPLEPPQTLLQLLHSVGSKAVDVLNRAMEEVIGEAPLCLDDSRRVELSLRVGTAPETNNDPRERARAFARLPPLESLPDSTRRCVALMLACILLPGRALLVDALDAGFAPELALRLGRWLANHVQEFQVQLFVAAGSEALIEGLLQGQADTTLVRTRRRDDAIHCHAVPPETLRSLESSAVLHAGVGLRCLSADALIVTESETEQAIFQTLVENTLPAESRVLAISSFGSGPLLENYALLKTLGIPVAFVGYLDLLASSERFAALVRHAVGDAAPRAWQTTRDRLAATLEGVMDREALAENTRELESFLSKLEQSPAAAPSKLSPTPVDTATRWKAIRQRGLAAVPGDQRSAVEELLEDLKRVGVYLSPVGNVRQWFADARGKVALHWFPQALRLIRRGACPEPLLAAFREISTWLTLKA